MKNKHLILQSSLFLLFSFKIAYAANSRDQNNIIGNAVLAQQEIQLYISPNGLDSNKGSKDQPLKSLDGAKQRIRVLRKGNRELPVRVFIGGGIYALEKPVLFSAEDSGSEKASVVYQAQKGQQPIITGSRKLNGWAILKDREILKRLDPNAAGKVYFTDLKLAGISDFGDPTDIGLHPELFCNKQPQTLARWPNSGFTKAGQVNGKTPLPATYISSRGTKEGDFRYLDIRQDRWALESDPRMEGYWYWDWSEQYQKVARIDTVTKTVHIKEPYHNYGYRDSLRYFGLNLLCELDAPKEWYLDRKSGLLYWIPPAGINPAKAQVSLSVFSAPFMVEMQDCVNLFLKGLSFQESRASAINIKESTNCMISECRIERFGVDGISIQEGKANGVSACMLRTLGCGGIKISGGDRKILSPSGHYVENTIVEDFSLFKRTYQPAVHLQGCGHRISHNRFRNSSSSALRLEGNDHIIEYNQISQVVNESDDQGGLDVFLNPSYRGNTVRFNHWANISGGTRHGAAGVRLDDMISGFSIYGNIFEKCGAVNFGAIQIHGGKDNTVENNVFFKCPAGISFSTWGEKRWLKMLDSSLVQKKLYQEVDINSELYQSRYPALKTLRESADVNTITNNLLIDCDKVFFRDKSIQVAENNTSIKSNDKSLISFLDSSYLSTFGLKRIPYSEIGPKSNPWVGD
ncbi:right-handed parallel beta-helix repeat-containing protein [Dyadobacter psychrotolerans]|uniref:Right-handed parallel beta-helix repeat-containing protein n=2 Tax=Dyadobacter psychrotolerans TaxID=2541721 RepID=A0A4R5DDP6_9BACT|nr:right-handed parallel beta-helix repeat-containing protein [Dyadobacter psychrotolerans]TDE08393.1 right-handed parallel beta-helix repeat-containing protein [Dyadobacter psychrotolerans]